MNPKLLLCVIVIVFVFIVLNLPKKNTDQPSKRSADFDLDTRVAATLESLQALSEDLKLKHKELDEKEQRWKAIEERMASNAARIGNKIKLNIGGKQFTTTKSTLMSQPSYFKSMLTSDHNQQDENGEFFIDRNPKLFDIVLDYLRNGVLRTNDLTKHELAELKADLEFYQIQLPVPKGPFNDSAILSNEQQNVLGGFLPNYTFKRIYKATQDGFNAYEFHQKCDNKGPTLVVIQSSEGYIFGGYTSESWTGMGSRRSGSNGFIFTLTNPYNYVAKFSVQQSSYHYALYDNANNHASFGDIMLSSNPNLHQNNINFPKYYYDPSGHSSTLFTGSSKFIAREIEVFTMSPNNDIQKAAQRKGSM